TAKTSKMASAEAADVAASAEAADVAAAAKAAMTTAETATTGVRCEGHERNCEQQHRGSGDAGLQHRPHVSEFSQFRFCDRRYRCEPLRVARICRRGHGPVPWMPFLPRAARASPTLAWIQPPCQPGPDSRISNWRGAVSGYPSVVVLHPSKQTHGVVGCIIKAAASSISRRNRGRSLKRIR